jgi:hypothetical protein
MTTKFSNIDIRTKHLYRCTYLKYFSKIQLFSPPNIKGSWEFLLSLIVLCLSVVCHLLTFLYFKCSPAKLQIQVCTNLSPWYIYVCFLDVPRLNIGCNRIFLKIFIKTSTRNWNTTIFGIFDTGFKSWESTMQHMLWYTKCQ